MRIAFLVGVFPRISETFILNQAVGLLEQGHEVEVFPDKRGRLDVVHPDVRRFGLLARTVFPPRPLSLRTWIAGWRYPAAFGLGARYGRSCSLSRLLPALASCPRGRQYDVIHAHFGGNGLKAAALRELGAMRGRIITTFYGQDATSYPHSHGRDCYRELFARGDGFLAVSQHLVNAVCRLGCSAEKIRKLHIGVRPGDFPFRARVLHPNEPIRLLTVARLVEKKGLTYALEAVARVSRDFPRTEYRIIGEGPLRGQLQQQIRRLGLEARVKLPGAAPHDQIRKACAESHLFLLPSVTASSGDQEGQPLVLVEAQCSGLPVVATRHSGIPECVQDGDSGFLVPERDVEALAERLHYLLSHPERWAEMGRAGRHWVEHEFDNAKLTRSLIAAYGVLLGGQDLSAGTRPPA